MHDPAYTIQKIEVMLARVEERIIGLDQRLRNMALENKDLVRKSEFIPVKNICFGFAGAILMAFLGFIIDRIVNI